MSETKWSNWMRDMASTLSGRKLRNICLPAMHDAASSTLCNPPHGAAPGGESDFFAGLGGRVLVAVDEMAAKNKAYEAIYNTAVESIGGLARCSARTPAQALADGMRCLDLRLYFDIDRGDGGTLRVCHGDWVGGPVQTLLAGIGDFVRTHAGEVVYLTWRISTSYDHPSESQFAKDISAKVQARACEALADLLQRHLAGSCISPEIFPNPFEATYDQLVGAVGDGAAVINTCNLAVEGCYGAVFSASEVGAREEAEESSPLIGAYTDTSDPRAMRVQQRANFEAADREKAFALYATLTPSPPEYARIVATDLVTAGEEEFKALLRSVVEFEGEKRWWKDLIGFIPGLAADGVDEIADWIVEKIREYRPEFGDLRSLSLRARGELTGMVGAIVRHRPSVCPLSFLYLDFYEDSDVLDVVTRLNRGELWTWSRVSKAAPAATCAPDLIQVDETWWVLSVDEDDRIVYRTRGADGLWSERSTVINGYDREEKQDQDARSGAPVSAAIWNGLLHVFYSKPGSDGELRYAVRDQAGKWTVDEVVRNADGHQPKTAAGVRALALPNGVLLAYNSRDEDHMLTLFGEGREKAGFTWGAEERVVVSGDKVSTTARPALALLGDDAHLVFSAGRSLRHATHGLHTSKGTLYSKFAQWSDRGAVEGVKLSDTGNRPAPGLCARFGGLVLVWPDAEDVLTGARWDQEGWTATGPVADQKIPVPKNHADRHQAAVASGAEGELLVALVNDAANGEEGEKRWLRIFRLALAAP